MPDAEHHGAGAHVQAEAASPLAAALGAQLGPQPQHRQLSSSETITKELLLNKYHQFYSLYRQLQTAETWKNPPIF